MGGSFLNTDFSYIQLPLFLFNCDRYTSLSLNAKLLYALILNRMKLSKKNADTFSDESGIFIYFSNSSIKNFLNCGKNQVYQALDELEDAGLIRKIRKRIGMPFKIYVNDISLLHEKSKFDGQANTYKPKLSFKPKPVVIPERNVSFDIERAERLALSGDIDFGNIKNKKRRKR